MIPEENRIEVTQDCAGHEAEDIGGLASIKEAIEHEEATSNIHSLTLWGRQRKHTVKILVHVVLTTFRLAFVIELIVKLLKNKSLPDCNTVH